MADELESLGEDQLISILCRDLTTSPDLVVGPGDDCAVLRSPRKGEYLLLKTDAVVAGVHFRDDCEPERVGWKAAARVVSDLAAMGGGQPGHALITLFARSDRSVSWLQGVYRGLECCARTYQFDLVGGETSRLPENGPSCILSVAMLGSISEDRCVLRSGSVPGDSIWVTGALGGSLETGKHLDFEPRLREARALADTGQLHALMDLSDGLARDLPRLAEAGGVGFRLDREAVPRTPGCSLEQALGDGEDYELLFTVPPGVPIPIDNATCIGTIVPREDSEHLRGGWDHFA